MEWRQLEWVGEPAAERPSLLRGVVDNRGRDGNLLMLSVVLSLWIR